MAKSQTSTTTAAGSNETKQAKPKLSHAQNASLQSVKNVKRWALAAMELVKAGKPMPGEVAEAANGFSASVATWNASQ